MKSTKTKFFTGYDFPSQIIDKVFDKVMHEYGFAFNDNGVRYLAIKRDIDIQSEVNAFENDSNIYNLLNRYMYGDTTALNKSQSVYADISTTPKSLQEALNIQIRLKDDFLNMKPEVRAEFNNDFNQYIASVSSGKAFDIFKKFGMKSERDVSLEQMNSELNKIKEVNNSDNN